MILRQAEARDAAQVAAIWNCEIRKGVSTFNSVEKTDEEIAQQIHERGTAFIVAEEAGQVLGFATYSQFRGGVGYTRTMEHTIHLHEDARGRGLGRTLMAAIEEVARQAGVHVLVAGVADENEAGIAFHASLGFEHVGLMPQVGRKHGRWLDLVLMQKIL